MTPSVSYSQLDIVRDDVQESARTANVSVWFSWANFGNWLMEWFSRKPIKQFTRLHLELEGVHKIVVDSEQVSPDPQKDYKVFSDLVVMLTTVNRLYRRADYFENEELRRLMNETTALAYDIEVELKVRAYSSKKVVRTDENIKAALSAHSRYALLSKLSHRK